MNETNNQYEYATRLMNAFDESIKEFDVLFDDVRTKEGKSNDSSD